MPPPATMLPTIFIGGFAAIALVSLLVNHLLEKKRTAALRSAAESMGLAFAPAAGAAMLSSLGHFSLFSQGRSRRISNLMRGGTRDSEFAVFDYRYATGSGRSSCTWKQTVILVRSPNMALPPFTIRPENLFHRIGSALGGNEIALETDPDFSRDYLLKGREEAEVRRVFNSSVRTFFAQRAKLCAEGAGGELIIYRSARRVDPDGVAAFRDDGLSLFTLLKARR